MGVVLLKRKLTSFQIIILGFSGVILFGTFLLMLPFSSRSGLATPFSDALFTSTSAVCVTGLIIRRTCDRCNHNQPTVRDSDLGCQCAGFQFLFYHSETDIPF